MKAAAEIPHSQHFDLQQLAPGVHACWHRPGGLAHSNAGIIDLGDHTLVVDAFDSVAAARDLRLLAETLYDRPVETLVLTHSHNDHWLGARVFGRETAFWATEITKSAVEARAEALLADFAAPDRMKELEAEEIRELSARAEADERWRPELESRIQRKGNFLVEAEHKELRLPDHTFTESVSFSGQRRSVDLVSYGRGHSDDDAILILPRENIAFIGDIGFFNLQPFMGFCDLDLWRDQFDRLIDADLRTLVPGHGTLGSRREIARQMDYFDLMEEKVGRVVQEGGSLEEALQVELPPPFDGWLAGGMRRFEMNVRYLYQRAGGRLPAEG